LFFSTVDVVNAQAISGVAAPVGTPGAGENLSPERYIVADKSKEALGIEYRNVKETIVDALRSGLELGWKP